MMQKKEPTHESLLPQIDAEKVKEAAANAADLKPARARAIFKQIHAAVSTWQTHAESANVSAEWREEIRKNHRLDLHP